MRFAKKTKEKLKKLGIEPTPQAVRNFIMEVYWKKKLSFRQIERIYGFREDWVRAMAKKLGVPVRPKGGPNFKGGKKHWKIKGQALEKALQMAKEGRPYFQIAARLGVSYQLLVNTLHRLGYYRWKKKGGEKDGRKKRNNESNLFMSKGLDREI